MPGDHRNLAGRNRARHHFLVERPQIFERTAAARDDDHVRDLCAIEISQRGHNFRCRAFALHVHRITAARERLAKRRLQYAQNVANGRAGR